MKTPGRFFVLFHRKSEEEKKEGKNSFTGTGSSKTKKNKIQCGTIPILVTKYNCTMKKIKIIIRERTLMRQLSNGERERDENHEIKYQVSSGRGTVPALNSNRSDQCKQ